MSYNAVIDACARTGDVTRPHLKQPGSGKALCAAKILACEIRTLCSYLVLFAAYLIYLRQSILLS